jgi:hypothetical protein
MSDPGSFYSTLPAMEEAPAPSSSVPLPYRDPPNLHQNNPTIASAASLAVYYSMSNQLALE